MSASGGQRPAKALRIINGKPWCMADWASPSAPLSHNKIVDPVGTADGNSVRAFTVSWFQHVVQEAIDLCLCLSRNVLLQQNRDRFRSKAIHELASRKFRHRLAGGSR